MVTSPTRDDRGTVVGSTFVGTNSAGTALGDHIKVGNSCVSVGSWSNTDHCHMGIALGYQSNTSNESEKLHTATAYSFCAGMGSRIEGDLLHRHRQGGYVEDGCGHSIVLGGYSRSEVLSDIVISGGHATATRCGSSVRASPAGR